MRPVVLSAVAWGGRGTDQKGADPVPVWDLREAGWPGGPHSRPRPRGRSPGGHHLGHGHAEGSSLHPGPGLRCDCGRSGENDLSRVTRDGQWKPELLRSDTCLSLLTARGWGGVRSDSSIGRDADWRETMSGHQMNLALGLLSCTAGPCTAQGLAEQVVGVCAQPSHHRGGWPLPFAGPSSQ